MWSFIVCYIFYNNKNNDNSNLLYIVTIVGYYDIGDPEWECEHCNALMWFSERVQKRWKTKICFTKGISEAKKNLKNIRSFNMVFSFTSMGERIDVSTNKGNVPLIFIMKGENYYRIGSLLPLPGNQPKFAQLYIYDTNNEISSRMSVVW